MIQRHSTILSYSSPNDSLVTSLNSTLTDSALDLGAGTNIFCTPEAFYHICLSLAFFSRICPGKELADASMFMFIATCLAVLDIRKARDDNGQVVEPLYQYTPGIISHPMEFKCSIRPRSERAAAIIKHVEDEHPFVKSDADAIAQLKWE